MFKFTVTRTSLLALLDSLSSMSPLAETYDVPPGPGCIYQQADKKANASEKIFMFQTIPYDGTTVMHYHLLSHEDMDMTQAIKFETREAGMVGHCVLGSGSPDEFIDPTLERGIAVRDAPASRLQNIRA